VKKRRLTFRLCFTLNSPLHFSQPDLIFGRMQISGKGFLMSMAKFRLQGFLYTIMVSVCLFLSMASLPLSLLAQGPHAPTDGSVQLSQEDLRKRQLQDEFLQRQVHERPEIQIDGLRAPELGEQAQEKVIRLTAVDFENLSSCVTENELREIITPYLEQKVSLQDLYEIAHKIDLLYDEKGILGRVLIPPQDVKNGAVRMRFVEGSVGKVQIRQDRPFMRGATGEEAELTIYDSRENTDGWQDRRLFQPFVYKPHMLAHQFSSQEGDLIRSKVLEEELLRFNMVNLPQMQLELTAGEEVGETDLIYRLKSPKPVDLSVYCDNFGRPTTGEYRLGTMMNLNNFMGRGDRWFLNMIASPDGDLADTYVGGNVPLFSNGIAFIGSFEYTNYALVSGDFSVLEVDGWSRKGDFGFSLPVLVSQERLVRVYAKGMNYDSQNYFTNVPQHHFNVLAGIVGMTWERFGTDLYQVFDTSISTGRELNANGDRHRYTLWRGNWTGVRKLSEHWSVVGRLGFQIGSSKEPSIEMFQIGGIASVRGYTEGILAGDSGYFLNLELHRTLRTWQYRKAVAHGDGPQCDNASLTMFTFLDHGGVFPYKGAGEGQSSDDYLVSTGCGWILNVGKHFGAKALVSLPLYENALDYDYSDVRFNFMTQYQF